MVEDKKSRHIHAGTDIERVRVGVDREKPDNFTCRVLFLPFLVDTEHPTDNDIQAMY